MSKIKMSAGLVPFRGSEGELLYASLLAPGGCWQCLAFLDLKMDYSNLCLCLYVASFPVCLCILFLCLLRTLDVGFGAHSYNPG